MTKTLKSLAFSMLAALFVTFAAAPASAASNELVINDLSEGSGAVATGDAKVQVHYTGWLMDGTKFDSSVDRGKPFEFTLGARQVIPGWERGVEGMKVGGKRELIIPPHLAYGPKGAGAVIPPDATLRFEIELLGVTPPKYTNLDNAALIALLEKGTKIVDLRRADEWQKTGVVEGSIKLTAFDNQGNFVQSFPENFEAAVAKDEAVIVICRSGNRSRKIANLLIERAGYERVYNVANGIKDWIKAGNPVVQ